jgi:hypothetical protein
MYFGGGNNSGICPHVTLSAQCVHWFGCLTPHGQPPFWQHAQVYDEDLCGHWHPVNDAVYISISE